MSIVKQSSLVKREAAGKREKKVEWDYRTGSLWNGRKTGQDGTERAI
jgi:hypothetical protein